MKEGIPVSPNPDSQPEAFEKDLITREQEALLALGRLRQDPDVATEDIEAAETLYISLKREREREDGTENLTPPEDTEPWELPEKIDKNGITPFELDLIAKNDGERIEDDEEEEMKPKKFSKPKVADPDGEPIHPSELSAMGRIVDERKAEFAKSLDTMSPEELQDHIEYLDSQNRLARETDDELLKELVDGRLNDAASRLRTLDGAFKPSADETPDVEVPPEMKVEAKEVKAEIEKLPETEKQEISLGLNNIGFFVEKKKNEFFANTFSWIAETNLDQDKVSTRFFKNLGKTFSRDAESAQKKLENPDAGKMKALSNAGYLFGNVIKYGRTVADLAGATMASPLRYVMAAGMAFSRSGEAAKETRLENEAVIEKTRITDAEKAAEEAWKIYELAEHKSGGNVGKEDLKQAYLTQMPKDLVERLARDPGTANNFVQKVLRREIATKVNGIKSKFDLIDYKKDLSPEAKEAEKEKILRKYENELTDYDRILSQYGTVDALAMAGRYAQFAGKVVVGALTVETIALSLDKLWENLSGTLAHSESLVPSPGARDALDLKGASTGSGSSNSIDKYFAKDSLSSKPDSSVVKDSVLVRDSVVTKPDSSIVKDSLAVKDSAVVKDSIPSGGIAQDSTAKVLAGVSERATEAEIKGLEGGNIEASLDEKGVETVEKGGSVSASIHDMLAKGEITKKEFMEAWRNPESVVDVKGEKVHVSKMGLVYEGNQVKFIPGENGQPGRFDVVQGTGGTMGSDKDLYNRYEKLGKDAPGWLKKSLGIKEALPKIGIDKTHEIVTAASTSGELDPWAETVTEEPSRLADTGVKTNSGWHPEMKIRDAVNQAVKDHFNVEPTVPDEINSGFVEGPAGSDKPIAVNYSDPVTKTVIGGKVEFEYDSKGNPTGLNYSELKVERPAGEGSEWYLNRYTNRAIMNDSAYRSSLEQIVESVNKKILLYESIKGNTSLKPEADYLISSIKQDINSAEKVAAGVFDKSKLPQWLR